MVRTDIARLLTQLTPKTPLRERWSCCDRALPWSLPSRACSPWCSPIPWSRLLYSTIPLKMRSKINKNSWTTFAQALDGAIMRKSKKKTKKEGRRSYHRLPKEDWVERSKLQRGRRRSRQWWHSSRCPGNPPLSLWQSPHLQIQFSQCSEHLT